MNLLKILSLSGIKHILNALYLPAIFTLVICCGISCSSGNNPYGRWTIHNNHNKQDEPVWLDFYWVDDTLGNKYYSKTAMFIPVKIVGMPHTYSFQFDLGSDLTLIFEKNAESVFRAYPQVKSKIENLKSPMIFWNKQKAFKNLILDFGGIEASTSNCYLMRNYGQQLEPQDLNDSVPIVIGTIGADLFQNKILIIDYPNEKFAICDRIPENFKAKMVDIELDGSGRAILPMKQKDQTYRIMFDNGSSIFPLITLAKNIDKFSKEKDNDSIPIRSWGVVHQVTGRRLIDTFNIAGTDFANVEIYANHTGRGIDNATDGMAGNALFWNHTIIIDFKNKKFGVK